MAFNNLTKDVIPIIEVGGSLKTFNCKEFKGSLSSITGIVSKFMYIAKIDQLTGNSLNPTVRIICGSECKDKCINLK